MRCDRCGCTPLLRPLFRVNAKGEVGVFRCGPCGGVPEDREVARIARIIAGYRSRRSRRVR